MAMKYTLVIVMMFLLACSHEKTAQQYNYQKLTEEEKLVQSTFEALQASLKNEGGEFWNKNLYGPIILIDPSSRVFYANENNSKKEFTVLENFYTDTLPANLTIANTAFEWDAKRWTMVMLPLPENSQNARNLLIHELFHRIQPEIGFDSLQEANNGHLDTYDGRLWLKLELNALQQALNEENVKARENHISNALAFRSKRQDTDQKKSAENSLELNEGLAEYTGVSLSGRTDAEMNVHFSEKLSQFYQNPSFIRSFAYQTIPIYGHLLSQRKKHWHQDITSKSNLTDYLVNAFGLKKEDLVSLTEKNKGTGTYDYHSIAENEKAREEAKLEEIQLYKQLFLDESSLKLSFRNMNISFDPRNVKQFEEYGTVYGTLELVDEWGKLIAKNGALILADWSGVVVSPSIEITDSIVSGKDWTLTLNEGWKLAKENGVYQLKEHHKDNN